MENRKSIFSTYTFKEQGIQSINKIALAPMTNGQSHPDGTLGVDEYNWLVRRAQEGFGIIITCAAHVSKDGQGWPGELGIFSDIHIPGLTTLAKALHKYKSLGIVQLFHGGARSPDEVTGTKAWSSSQHILHIGTKSLEIRQGSYEEIDQTIIAFKNAALRAQKAGFDGIELHGAHGYLLHQFISSTTNQRTDLWGGSFENRIRLIRTILKEIKESVSGSFIVGVRLSPEDKYAFKGIDFDESLELAKILADDGADYIHVSPWDALKKPDKYPDSDKTLITYFREAVKSDVAIVVAGEIWSSDDAQRALDMGADIIALGRAAIGIPDWPTRALNPKFIPMKPPYTTEHLKQAQLSGTFIDYMKRWKGFVE